MMYTGSHEGTSTNVFYRSHTNKNKKIRRGGGGGGGGGGGER